MKVLKDSAVLVEQTNILDQIEKGIRTCKQSTIKDSETRDELIRRVIRSGHESVLRHGNLIVRLPSDTYASLKNIAFERIELTDDDNLASFNVQTIRDLWRQHNDVIDVNDLLKSLSNDCPVLFDDLVPAGKATRKLTYVSPNDLSYKQQFIHAAMSVNIVTSRRITHRIVRHVLSPSQESSRYCAYTENGKFGGVTFIQHPDLDKYVNFENCRILDCIPFRFENLWQITVVREFSSLEEAKHVAQFRVDNNFTQDDSGKCYMKQIDKYPDEVGNWVAACLASERHYMDAVDQGFSKDFAGDLLNHAVKSEIFLTSKLKHWNWVFHERLGKGADNQIMRLFQSVLEQAQQRWPKIFENYTEDLRFQIPDSLKKLWS